MFNTILLVVSLVLSVITVNGAYQLLMKITGANSMFYSIKKKLTAYCVVGFIYFTIFISLFDIGS